VALKPLRHDSADEIVVVRRACEAAKVPFAVSDVFARGGEGGVELAEAVMAHAERRASRFRPLYDRSEPIKTKMEKVSRAMLRRGRGRVDEGSRTRAGADRQDGLQRAATVHREDPEVAVGRPLLLGRPEEFNITVRDVILAAGAGYVVPLLGDIMRMPGLPAVPQAERMDLVNGEAVGVSAPLG